MDLAKWSGKLGGIGEDNSYAATFGDAGVGAKAQSVLGQVRGKGFTKGKNKFKKQALYRGGRIDLGSNSIKFDE